MSKYNPLSAIGEDDDPFGDDHSSSSHGSDPSHPLAATDNPPSQPSQGQTITNQDSSFQRQPSRPLNLRLLSQARLDSVPQQHVFNQQPPPSTSSTANAGADHDSWDQSTEHGSARSDNLRQHVGLDQPTSETIAQPAVSQDETFVQAVIPQDDQHDEQYDEQHDDHHDKLSAKENLNTPLNQHQEVDSDEDLFDIDQILSKRNRSINTVDPLISQLREQSLHDKFEEKYQDFLDKDEEIKLNMIEIEEDETQDDRQLADQQGGFEKEFERQRLKDEYGFETIAELRDFERQTRENHAINRVKKLQDILQKIEREREYERRLKYREMSDSARHYFKKKEDFIKMKLEKKKAFMKATRIQSDSQKKQWTLEWDREPQLLDIRLCQVRSVQDKLPEGTYVLLVSLWNRLGGYPLQFSRHNTKVKKSTSEIYHGGNFDDVSMVFDEIIRTSGPSVKQITPRMVLVFELLCLKKGSGSQQIRVNKTVAWGAFPVVDNNLRLIQGCYKVPMIKGDVDLNIDKHSQIQKITQKNVKYWLGNLYFEVKHSGVDRAVRDPEEYMLEVLREDEDPDAGDVQLFGAGASNSFVIKKKALQYRTPLIGWLKPKRKRKTHVSREVQLYKNNDRRDKNLVLTMAQPRIWFGNPRFSVLSQTQKKIEEEESELQTIEAETEVEFSDDENQMSNANDEHSIDVFENEESANAPAEEQPLLQTANMEEHQPPQSSRPLPSARKQVGSRQVSRQTARGMLSSRFGRPMTSGFGRPMTSGFGRPTTSGTNRPTTGASVRRDGSTARGSDAGNIFTKDDDFFVFGGGGDDSQPVATGRSVATSAAAQSFRKPRTVGAPEAAGSVFDAPALPAAGSIEEGEEFEEEEDPMAQYYAQYQEKAIKTVKDVQKVYNSLFRSIFELSGATRMDLNFYKQSVRRKKHSWGGTPIYWEKLLYVKKSILIDMGLSSWRTLEFFLMLIFSLLILVVRAYPHYLGHWIYLSTFRIPINRTDESNFYHTAYFFRGEFRNTGTNFGYVLSGMLFNMVLSFVLFSLTAVGQFLFSELPTLIYRFVFLYGFATVIDPILVAFVGAAFRDWQTDAFRLAGYFLTTEKSTVPGILVTIAMLVPLMVIQTAILYQYTLRVHMNRRILDVFRRLHARENKFFVPHDQELNFSELKNICEKAKKWRGPEGHTRMVTISEVPIDRTDYIMLERLDTLLMCKSWPSDYVTTILEQEQEFYDSEHTIHIPKELLSSTSRPAVFLRKNQFGKQFSITNFPMLADAILFDTFPKKDQRWRLLRMERLLIDYRMIGRMLLRRLREGKLITAHLMNTNIREADYDVFTGEDVELVQPEKKVIPKTGLRSIPYRISNRFKKIIGAISRCGPRFGRKQDNISAEEKFFGDLDEASASATEDDLGSMRNMKSDDRFNFKTKCKHIVIYNVSLTRERTVWRHFVRCPNGSLCEVFDKVENQEASSAIADPKSNDYWLRKSRIEISRKQKMRTLRRQNTGMTGGSFNMSSFYNA